jgi:hypothetical protein
MTTVDSASDFLQGQKDCQSGTEHKPNMSRDYDRGYRAEYQKEQVMSELSRSVLSWTS